MATDYTAFLDALSAALDTRDLALLERDGSLPAITVGTLPLAIGKNVANGVAALNSAGLPVDTSGRPMAVIGTTTGTAADAAVVAGQITTAQAAATSAQTAATNAVGTANAASAAIPPEANTSRNHFPVAVTGGTAPYRFPARPAWQGPVIFNMMGLNCELPGNDGQLTGGGGMYPLRDELKT